MKSKEEYCSPKSNTFKNLWLKMKISVFIFLITLLPLSANTLSQTLNFSKEFRGSNFEEFMEFVENKTDYKFFLSNTKVNVNQKITKPSGEQTIKDAVDLVLNNLQLDYKITNEKLILVVGEKNIQQDVKTITGKVTDKNGEALPGVTVYIKGTTNGTITDTDGNYSISNVKETDVLVYSFVGMETKEVTVGFQTSVTISLSPEAIGLNEVIAVGYGYQRKANLTGAVGSIKKEDLKKAQVANASNAIVGRLSGVIAKQATGEPGADGSDIYIRGVATFQGNTTPGVIIDGIERTMSDFSQLDPNEIESVNVLKDAAAAAIFGMRGANGVIVVETVRGAKGKPSFSYSYNCGIQSPTKLPEFTNSYEYALLLNERNALMGNDPAYTQEQLNKFKDGSDPDRYPNTDWYDLIMENDYAIQQQHNLSIKGGTENVKYFTSLGYLDQGGFYDALNFERYNLRSNIDLKLSNTTTFSADISARMENTDEASTPSNNIFKETLRNTSVMRPIFSNGKLAQLTSDQHQNTYGVILEGGYSDTETNTLLTRLELEQELPFIKGLSVKGVFSYDKSYTKNKTWTRTPQEYKLEDDGTYTKIPRSKPTLRLNQDDNQFLELQSHLMYKRSFGDHDISGLAMFLQKKNKVNASAISAWDFSSEALEQIDAAALKNATGLEEEHFGRQSYIGRLNYVYKQRYMFEANIRRDGTENFAPDYRWGTFSSFSLGWIISEEQFFKNKIDFIDHLKIRGSYGTLGNDQINSDRFSYYNKYNTYSSMVYISNNINYGDYFFGNSYVKGFEPGLIGNPKVSWETSTKSNIAFDARIFNNIDLSFDYFKEKRSDILTQRSASVPLHFGAQLPMENIGEVENKGIEASISYNKKINDFHFFVNTNLTYAKNKIISMDEAEGTSDFLKREGRPIDAYYGYQAVGIFKDQNEIDSAPKQELEGAGYKTKPGDVWYADISGDGVVNSDDRTYLGKGNTPDIIYGISGGIEYKNIDFSFLVQGAAEVQIQFESQIVWPFFNMGGVPQFWADNHWSPDNPNVKYSNLDVNNHNFPKDAASSLYIYDASYIRLKNIELGYSLPKSLLSKINLEKVRLYVGGQNLLTHTTMPQLDPETVNNEGQSYPNVKAINFGVKVDF